MDNIQKFYSDIEKAKKFARADNGGRYDWREASRRITELFERENRNCASLARSFSDFWQRNYVDCAEDLENAPDQAAIEKLVALHAFINNDEQTDALSASDWEEIKEMVNCEAEDLPIETLSDMMKIIVEKGAL